MNIEELSNELESRSYYFDSFYDFYLIQQKFNLQYSLCWESREIKCLNIWKNSYKKQVFLRNEHPSV